MSKSHYKLEGIVVYLTADHGNVTATGIGNPREGVLVETRGKRARVYDRPEFREEVAVKFPESIRWPNHGLPPAQHVLLAADLKAFTDEGDEIVLIERDRTYARPCQPNCMTFARSKYRSRRKSLLCRSAYLRDVALTGCRQIYFATANDKLATLFERKFDFLGREGFRRFDLRREKPAVASSE